jgi:hypothetical protein
VGVPGDNEQATITGYHAVHLVAHSYLGTLSIALDQRNGVPGKPVLLRRLQRSAQTSSEALQRMACAARDAMALSHENVLPVIAVALQEDALGIVYEYVEAEPLRSLQSWSTHRGLAIPVGVSLRIIVDLLRGVRALHGTLLGWPSAPPFGGLSPDSVLVSRDGRTRLCDPLLASCATLLEGMNLNASKLAYTAPEQAYATAPLAAPSDVFSCAVMLWELLAGSRLFVGARHAVERKLLEHDVPSLRAQLPAERQLSERLVLLVERSLAADAGRRPQSPAELASELEQSGHELASLAQVAAFVGDLATVRFEQRRMTVRSLPALRMPAAAAPGPGVSSANRRVPLPADVSGSSAAFRSPLSNLGLSAPAAATPSAASRGRPLIALAERPSAARWTVPKLPALAGLAPSGAEVPVAEAPHIALVPSEPPPPAERVALVPAEARVAAPAPPVIAVPAPRPVPLPVESAPARSESVPVPVESAPAHSEPVSGPVELAPARSGSVSGPVESAPARSESVPVPVESRPSDSVPRVRPVGSTTMVGLAMPPLLTANRPFDSVVPAAPAGSQAVVVIPPDPDAERTSTPSAPPMPIRSLVPTLRPSAHGLGAAFANSQRELLARGADSGPNRPSGWSQVPASSQQQPRKRAALASVVATFALSGALGAVLWLRSGSQDSALPVTAALAAPRAPEAAPAPPMLPPEPAAVPPAAVPPAAVPPAAVPPAAVASAVPPEAVPPAAVPSPDTGAAALPAATAAVPEAPKLALEASSPLEAAQLGDAQLLELFALERRVQLPTCSERLGASARPHTGVSFDKSQAALKAARRELMRGNNAEAQQLLCSATLQFPDNVAAWQALADLALHLGDGTRAEEAIEQALKRKPGDLGLLASQGDIAAVLGNLAQSRALWAKGAGGSAGDPGSVRRLAQQFAALGERKLHDWSYGAALVQYRRAVVLSRGDPGPSAGMGEALRLLGQPQAALAWADRAASRSGR